MVLEGSWKRGRSPVWHLVERAGVKCHLISRRCFMDEETEVGRGGGSPWDPAS